MDGDLSMEEKTHVVPARVGIPTLVLARCVIELTVTWAFVSSMSHVWRSDEPTDGEAATKKVASPRTLPNFFGSSTWYWTKFSANVSFQVTVASSDVTSSEKTVAKLRQHVESTFS